VRSTDAIGAGTSDCRVTGGLVAATFGVAGEDGSGGRAKSDRTSCACGGVGAIGFGASGCGTSGLGASGFGASGFGTSGFGASGFGTSGLGVSGSGTSGFGVSGFGTSDRGASGFVVLAIASGLTSTSTERARSKSMRGIDEGVAVSGRSREASSGRVSGVVLAPGVVSTFAGGGD
jgi:PPE-repeat protein